MASWRTASSSVSQKHHSVTFCTFNLLNKHYIRHFKHFAAQKSYPESYSDVMRCQEAVSNILHLDPDMAALQEMHPDWEASLKRDLGSRYDIHYVRHPRVEGDGVAVIYKRCFQLINASSVIMGEKIVLDKNVYSGGGSKALVSLNFRDTRGDGDRTISVTTTHIPLAQADLYAENLIDLSEGLLNVSYDETSKTTTLLKSSSTSRELPHLQIIAGDLNFERNSSTFKKFAGREFLTDGSLEVTERFPWQMGAPLKRIDHIFAKTRYYASQKVPLPRDMPFPRASDHVPVLTRFWPLSQPLASPGAEIAGIDFMTRLRLIPPTSSSSSTTLMGRGHESVSSSGTSIDSKFAFTDPLAKKIFNEYCKKLHRLEWQFHGVDDAVLDLMYQALNHVIRQSRQTADKIPDYISQVMSIFSSFLRQQQSASGVLSDITEESIESLLETLNVAYNMATASPSVASEVPHRLGLASSSSAAHHTSSSSSSSVVTDDAATFEAYQSHSGPRISSHTHNTTSSSSSSSEPSGRNRKGVAWRRNQITDSIALEIFDRYPNPSFRCAQEVFNQILILLLDALDAPIKSDRLPAGSIRNYHNRVKLIFEGFLGQSTALDGTSRSDKARLIASLEETYVLINQSRSPSLAPAKAMPSLPETVAPVPAAASTTASSSSMTTSASSSSRASTASSAAGSSPPHSGIIKTTSATIITSATDTPPPSLVDMNPSRAAMDSTRTGSTSTTPKKSASRRKRQSDPKIAKTYHPKLNLAAGMTLGTVTSAILVYLGWGLLSYAGVGLTTFFLLNSIRHYFGKHKMKP